MNINFKSKIFLIGAIIFTIIALTQNTGNTSYNDDFETNGVDEIKSDSLKSLEAFGTILKVLKDPRCVNCHPSGDRPRQGDDHHIHLFNVQRGDENHGGPVQKCATCHQRENNPFSNVPGAPHWGLAPKSMGWYGLSDVEISHRLINKQFNGGRGPKELVQHMKNDSLVLWGWSPGAGRPPVSVPLEEFKTALDTWIENGAHVPTK